jgi:hypothetical protein
VKIGFRVLSSPVFVEHLGYAVQDTIRTGLIGETVVYGPGAPSHVPESPFRDIGGADGFPALWTKVITIHTILYDAFLIII